MSRDQGSQWQSYADCGKGFAMGFNLLKFLSAQRAGFQSDKPYLFCCPVCYQPDKQQAVIRRAFESAILDMKRYADSCSPKREELTAFYRRVLSEVLTVVITCIDFIKSPKYASEREMRIALDPNNGTLEPQHIRHHERDGATEPYIFFDLRIPITGRLPLDEIIIGPKATMDTIVTVEQLLDDAGYGNSTHSDRPKVLQSSIKPSPSL